MAGKASKAKIARKPPASPRVAEGRMTMADLARLCGVSSMTVSRALGDSQLVNAQTRELVRKTAREHGYLLNVTARNLRTRRSHTVAVIVEMTPSSGRSMSDPYPLELLGGISEELTAHDYSILLTTRQGAMTSAVRAADGVILLGQGAHEEAVQTFSQWQLPMVVWGAKHARDKHVVVGSDNRQGGLAVAERFRQLGRRRAIFVGDVSHAEMAERLAGFRAGLAKFNAEVRVVPSRAFTMEAGVEALRHIAQRERGAFDAVFACNDLLAMGVIRVLSELGIRVPDDVTVIGYDDTPVGATFIPPLSSVHQNWREGGILLARKVLQLIGGGSVRSESLPTALVIRAT